MKTIFIINPPRFDGKNVRRDERSADILESEVSPFYQGAALAQYLRINNNASVFVLDANGLDYNYEQTEKWIAEHGQADFAIIKAADDTLLHDVKTAQICKNYGIITLLWEPILSPAEPENVFLMINQKKNIIDYLILGEAELTVSDFLKQGNAAAGIAYFKNGKFYINQRNENDRLQDLNQLPIPDFSELPLNNYQSWFGIKPWMTMFTSRGCFGKCKYCLIGGSTVFRGYGNKVRLMSAERILKEVKILIKNYNIKHITFWDDCFTLDKQRVIEFCDLVIKEKLFFTWSCMARTDTIDEELIKKMKIAGLTRIGYGVESGSQKILNSIPKNVTVEDNYQAIKLAKKYNIWVWIFIIVGLPEESWQTVEETIKFIKKSKPNFMFLGCNTVFPGTVNYEYYVREKMLENNILDLITEKKLVTGSSGSVPSKYMTIEEIENAKFLIHRAFVFSSPKIIINKIFSNLLKMNWKYIKRKILYFIFSKYEDSNS